MNMFEASEVSVGTLSFTGWSAVLSIKSICGFTGKKSSTFPEGKLGLGALFFLLAKRMQ